MRVLLIVSDLFIGEPIGALQLAAIVRAQGHQVELIGLRSHPLLAKLHSYLPDVIAYSAASPEIRLFQKADQVVLGWCKETGRKVPRIMGGPHPTYFPEILGQMDLEAVCIGDGDHAIVLMLDALAGRRPLDGIPNVLPRGGELSQVKFELTRDLDSLPFIDREVYYQAMPIMQDFGLRGLMVGRGCPYDCTYCHNHAFKQLFRGCGSILRRRSVGHVIEELKEVRERFPRVTLFKFTDDTFAYHVDDWLLEFLERYRREIGLPFYCLMRSNTLSREMAQRLAAAGCVSMCMAVEHGSERVRNEILKRGISDELLVNSFRHAREAGIKTWGNTLFGIPGTSFQDDYNSFLFTRKLTINAPTFGPFYPYPKTLLTTQAIGQGWLPENYDSTHTYGHSSPLTCFSEEDKRRQLALSYLGPVFCRLPDFMLPLLRCLIGINLLNVYRYIGASWFIVWISLNIFPGIYPKNPLKLLRIFLKSLRFWVPGKEIHQLRDKA